jgi:hypothetical protein
MLAPISDRLTKLEEHLGIRPRYRGSASSLYNIMTRLDACIYRADKTFTIGKREIEELGAADAINRAAVAKERNAKIRTTSRTDLPGVPGTSTVVEQTSRPYSLSSRPFGAAGSASLFTVKPPRVFASDIPESFHPASPVATAAAMESIAADTKDPALQLTSLDPELPQLASAQFEFPRAAAVSPVPMPSDETAMEGLILPGQKAELPKVEPVSLEPAPPPVPSSTTKVTASSSASSVVPMTRADLGNLPSLKSMMESNKGAQVKITSLSPPILDFVTLTAQLTKSFDNKKSWQEHGQLLHILITAPDLQEKVEINVEGLRKWLDTHEKTWT